MIKPRNQNKLKDKSADKPKAQKKQVKKGKKQVLTDVEQQQPQIRQQIPLQPKLIPQQKSKKHFPKFTLDITANDPSQVYQEEIIAYLKQLQPKYKINENYLNSHQVLNAKVRTFLLKFIFKIIWRFDCKRSTLYLAVYCMDLFLEKYTAFSNNVEGIAIAQAALHIAMKFEEIYPPELKQWTPDHEQIKKILSMQAQILTAINFKLNLPSVYYFEQYFQKKFFEIEANSADKENLYLQEKKIHLVSDLCLFDMSMYQFQPYELAKNIRMLVYDIQPKFNEERVVLNVKWAIERNRQHLDWLKENKYRNLG